VAKPRRLFRKDEYIGMRMPREDKRRFEKAAEAGRYDLSDLIWRSAIEGLEIIRKREPAIHEQLKQAGF
jgi:hypothetical protein